MNSFSLKQSLASAWHAIQEKPMELALAGLFLGVLEVVFVTFSPSATDYSLINFASETLWSFALVYILTVLSLSIRRGYPLLSFAHWKLRLIPMFFVTTFLFYLATFVGILALVVPGVLFIATYSMFAYVMIDKEVGVIASFRESARITKGSRWKILALVITTIVALYGVLFLSGLILSFLQTLFASLIPQIIVSLLTWTAYYLAGLILCVASADAYLQLSERTPSNSGQ